MTSLNISIKYLYVLIFLKVSSLHKNILNMPSSSRNVQAYSKMSQNINVLTKYSVPTFPDTGQLSSLSMNVLIFPNMYNIHDIFVFLFILIHPFLPAINDATYCNKWTATLVATAIMIFAPLFPKPVN